MNRLIDDLGMKTDIGNVRSENEDSIGYITGKYEGDQNLHYEFFVGIVCDGVGGSIEGKTCSKLVVSHYLEKIASYFHSIDQTFNHTNNVDFIRKGLENGHEAILDFKKGKYDENTIMGTTAVSIVYIRRRSLKSIKKTSSIQSESYVYVSNIGDSRVYAITQNGNKTTLEQLTKDHVNAKQELTSCLGVNRELKIDVFPLSQKKLVGISHLMLCSDGLYSELTEQEILDVFQMNIRRSNQTICQKLVNKICIEKNASDNISVMLLKIKSN